MVGLGFHEDRIRGRRRTRVMLSIFKWGLLLSVLGAIGYYGYEAGMRLGERDAIILRQQLGEVTERLQGLERDKAQLQRDLATTTGQSEELRRRYESDVPTGAISEFLRLARAKLGAGVKPERIAAVLGAVENTRACDDKPVSKRFVVRVPGQRPANDSASFADRAITLSASGAASVDGEGRPLGWFDIAKPVTITFTRIGGAETTASGMLPVHHSVVLNDMEHRFIVTNGDARGFVSVSSDSCKYP